MDIIFQCLFDCFHNNLKSGIFTQFISTNVCLFVECFNKLRFLLIIVSIYKNILTKYIFFDCILNGPVHYETPRREIPFHFALNES